jgi:hypothetical protein
MTPYQPTNVGLTTRLRGEPARRSSPQADEGGPRYGCIFLTHYLQGSILLNSIYDIIYITEVAYV